MGRTPPAFVFAYTVVVVDVGRRQPFYSALSSVGEKFILRQSLCARMGVQDQPPLHHSYCKT